MVNTEKCLPFFFYWFIELPAKIYFKPYNALEYIVIDFILTPEGISFDDI